MARNNGYDKYLYHKRLNVISLFYKAPAFAGAFYLFLCQPGRLFVILYNKIEKRNLKMFKKISLLFGFILAVQLLCAKTIVIYHTGDTHGYYFPRVIAGREQGGSAALSAVLNTEQTPYLLLDSGDFASGTAEAKNSKGMLSIDFMNMLPYNASTVGNHEADFSENMMLEYIKEAKFDILAANITDKDTGTYPKGVKPYNIYETAGVKIAVIGLARKPNTELSKVKFISDKKAFNAAFAALNKEKYDALVVLLHGSAEIQDSKQAPDLIETISQKPEVNLILGGHAHALVQNKKINNAIYVESGAELKGISKIELNFNDESFKLEDIASSYIELIIQNTGQDPKVKAFADEHYQKELDEEIARIGETYRKYNPGKDNSVDSPMANLVADIIKQAACTDIAMHNSGGVRMDLKKGPVTKRALIDILPFPNKIVIVNADGTFIQNTVLRALRENGSTFQYSGVTVKYAYKNKRPVLKEILINGVPLQKDKIYSIAINDYNTAGNSEGYMFKKLQNKTAFGVKTISDFVIEYFASNAKAGIAPAQTGRIIKVK
jgi:2',3'-cyclic-nucleotide 2'-phosphodiesterase (5'-nucleotidase family)